MALSALASAEAPPLTALLKLLALRGYSPGTMAPPLNGPTLEDRPLSAAELRGKVVVVNFWASWCLECRREMPQLEQIHHEFSPQGLAVVGINVRESQEAARRYAKELGLTFPLLLDPDGTISAAYGVVGLPTTIVIGRNGRAVGLAVGPREWAGEPARDIIEALLVEPAPLPGSR